MRVLLASVSLILLPATAIALCRAPLDPASAFKAADAVIYGIARTVRPGPPKFPGWAVGTRAVEFIVYARWKGAARDTVVVETYEGSGMSGFPFETGVTYLVYGTGRGDTVFTTHCDRTCADSAAYAEIGNLGKPVYDRRQGMDWKQLRDWWRATNGDLRVTHGQTFKN